MQNLTTNDWLNLGKFLLAAFLFAGYFLILILSMVLTLAADAGTIVLQGLAVLGPVIGAVAGSIWPRGNDQDKQTISDLASKVPPLTGEAKVSQDEALANSIQVVAQAPEEALPDWIKPLPEASGS